MTEKYSKLENIKSKSNSPNTSFEKLLEMIKELRKEELSKSMLETVIFELLTKRKNELKKLKNTPNFNNKEQYDFLEKILAKTYSKTIKNLCAAKCKSKNLNDFKALQELYKSALETFDYKDIEIIDLDEPRTTALIKEKDKKAKDKKHVLLDLVLIEFLKKIKKKIGKTYTQGINQVASRLIETRFKEYNIDHIDVMDEMSNKDSTINRLIKDLIKISDVVDEYMEKVAKVIQNGFFFNEKEQEIIKSKLQMKNYSINDEQFSMFFDQSIGSLMSAIWSGGQEYIDRKIREQMLDLLIEKSTKLKEYSDKQVKNCVTTLIDKYKKEITNLDNNILIKTFKKFDIITKKNVFFDIKLNA